jgi:hypothetical protein
VANYNVDLEIAVKGAERIKKTRLGIQGLSKDINKFNRAVDKQLGRKKNQGSFVNSFNNLSKEVSNARTQLKKASIGTTNYFKAIGKTVETQKQFNQAVRRQETDFKVVQRLQSKGLEINHKNIQLVRDELAAEIKLARAKKRTAKANLEKGQAGLQVNALRGLGGAVGSGIIGGGFPLLFGQGPTAALGGAIGGVAGGALSAIPGMGQFGFALSIAGTTIGSSLDDLTKSLTKPTENIENLVNRLGLVDTETGDLALELEKLGLTSSAAELLLKEFEREFGFSADQIKENAEKMTEFNNEINKLGTSLTLLLSDVLGPLIKELNQSIKGGKPEGTVRNILGAADFFTSNAFDLDKRGGILSELPPLTNKKSKGLSNIPVGEETVNNPDFGKPGFVIDPNQDKIDLKNQAIQVKEIEPLKQALEIEQNRLNLSGEKLRLMQENFALTNLDNEIKLLELERTDEVNDELEKKIEKLEIARDTQAQVVENTKALMDPLRQVSNIIAQDIGDGIRGLIRGTETLGGLLNNVINKLADGFINMGLFGNFGGTFEKGAGLLGSIFKAKGGPVKAGGSYIVGEKGPEMFSPGVSGTITPNHALGGSTTVIVNVDASGSSVEGDEKQGRELGRLISVAVQSELIQQKRPGGILA